jgi:predicted cupin superfamily sugar epimerase
MTDSLSAMTERTPASALTADEIIAHLKLGPHPEGGLAKRSQARSVDA